MANHATCMWRADNLVRRLLADPIFRAGSNKMSRPCVETLEHTLSSEALSGEILSQFSSIEQIVNYCKVCTNIRETPVCKSFHDFMRKLRRGGTGRSSTLIVPSAELEPFKF